MPKRSSRVKLNRDVNQVAASIIDAVDRLGDPASEKPVRTKNPAAVALGRLGGLKGGKARAESLTPDQRRDIARGAAKARWSRKET